MATAKMDVMEITEEVLAKWRPAPFQRDVRVNDKVRTVAEEIARDGVIPGVISLGQLNGTTYVLDGQHRLEAWRISGVKSALVDVRVHRFESMADMGREFVNLNSSLVRMRPDDVLRGLEAAYAPLRRLRTECPFLGYDMVRRNERAPFLSMSAALRVWFAASAEVPSAQGGPSAAALGAQLTADESTTLAGFLSLCMEAWGRDLSTTRLWGSLNLGICGWLYRRMVLREWSPRIPRVPRDLFRKGLMALAADATYQDWLVGRIMSDRDRSPCYDRIRRIMATRFQHETGRKAMMPQPPWYHAGSR